MIGNKNAANLLAFSPIQVGPMLLKNRFIRSATHETMSDSKGFPTSRLHRLIKDLADGEVGLIIPGFFYTLEKGKAGEGQSGITTLEHAQSWKETIDYVHSKGSKIVFQLAHCGMGSTQKGIEKVGPSAVNPLIMKGTRALTVPEIDEIIESYIKSAKLAKTCGADGVQLHAAHGYLLSEFLSPLINKRSDKYGGSLENNVRLIQEIANEIKKATSESSNSQKNSANTVNSTNSINNANNENGFSITIKMNGSDRFGGYFGVTPKIASQYVKMLENIDLFEISAGFGISSAVGRNSSAYRRGHDSLLTRTKNWLFDFFPYTNGFNVDLSERIKRENPTKMIASVGGHRDVEEIEEVLRSGAADLVSISRPLIRQPHLVKEMRTQKTKAAECVNCGMCLTEATTGKKGLHCYFPDRKLQMKKK